MFFTDFLLRIPPPDVDVKAVVVEVEATEKYKKIYRYTRQLNIKYLYIFAKSRPKTQSCGHGLF